MARIAITLRLAKCECLSVIIRGVRCKELIGLVKARPVRPTLVEISDFPLAPVNSVDVVKNYEVTVYLSGRPATTVHIGPSKSRFP